VYYPDGGTGDIKGTYWSIDDARAAADKLLDEELKDGDGIHFNKNQQILDTKTGRNYIRYISTSGYEWEEGMRIQ
jgi:hypothetical protein